MTDYIMHRPRGYQTSVHLETTSPGAKGQYTYDKDDTNSEGKTIMVNELNDPKKTEIIGALAHPILGAKLLNPHHMPYYLVLVR